MLVLKKLDKQGLTLIEVLITLVLLTLLASTVIAVYTPADLWIQQARHETEASFYARSILDNLRADRNKINATNHGKSADEIWSGHYYKPSGLSDLTSTIDIEKHPADLNRLFNITVTITWIEGHRPYTLVLKTVMRGEGLDD